MSRVIGTRTVSDHFEPDENVDPKVQRQLRGQLEQIDYAAYAANKKILATALTGVDAEKFQRLGSAAAFARARWAAAALAATQGSVAPTSAQIGVIADFRTAYEELTEAYDALRRMVERGYLTYTGSRTD